MAKDTVPPMLEISGIRKSFGGVHALKGGSLSLQPGEVHALVGENGAGKSTLIKIIAGIQRPDEGKIVLDGRKVEIASGSDALRLGFSFIHQELNLVPYFNASENIFLGRRYPTNALGLIDRRELERRSAACLAQLDVELPLRQPVSRLSRGQQSMIAIARAFADEARLYVMDEPTASLTDHEIRNLFAVIEKLRARGKTILYVSHRLDEIFELCDRVTVMKDGETVAVTDIADTDPRSLIKLMIGRNLVDNFPESKSSPAEEILCVEGLDRGKGRPVSFTLRAGEILGVAGLVGSGRSSLLKALGGAIRPRGGEISLLGKRYSPSSPLAAIHAGVLLVPEERRQHGLVLRRGIAENIALPNLRSLSRWAIFVDRRKELETAKASAESVRLKASSMRQAVGELSGGNQQKVVFAKWIPRDAKVLLLDEPTRGVDVGARYEIYKIVRDMAARGAGIILASSDLGEVLGLADRVMVMREGGVEAILDARGLDQESVLAQCYGKGSE